MPLRVRTAVLCAVMALFFVVPSLAAAATITYSDAAHFAGLVVYTADPGETLNTDVGYEATCTVPGGTTSDCVTFFGDGPATLGDSVAQRVCGPGTDARVTVCVLDDPGGGVHVVGGGGNDTISALPQDLDGLPAGDRFAVELDGGAGNDHVNGGSAADTLDGGTGADRLAGEGGDDVLHGGDGNDTLLGDGGVNGNDVLDGGNDRLYGDAGDDTLTGDSADTNAKVGQDVLDGGAGNDTVEDDWYRYDGDAHDEDAPPTVTFDGVANDGRPGENDDVLRIEHIKSGVPNGGPPATYVGDDGPNTIDLLFTNGIVRAGGGDDVINGSDYADSLDGGAGNDRISGGFDNDVITGGPGADDIGGDRDPACEYGPIYGSCTIGTGNDTIYAQDGEADKVDCGPGLDTAYVDAVDVTTACETIHEAGASPTPTPPPTCCSPPPVTHPKPRLSVPRQHLRKVAKARVLKATCRLSQRGRCTVKATITRRAARKLHLKTRHKTFTLGSAHRTLRKAGKTTVRIKLARKTARALRRAHSLRVTFRATARYADGGRRTKTAHATLRR